MRPARWLNKGRQRTALTMVWLSAVLLAAIRPAGLRLAGWRPAGSQRAASRLGRQRSAAASRRRESRSRRPTFFRSTSGAQRLPRGRDTSRQGEGELMSQSPCECTGQVRGGDNYSLDECPVSPDAKRATTLRPAARPLKRQPPKNVPSRAR